MDKTRTPLRITQSIQSTNQTHSSQIFLLLRKFNTDIRGMVYPTPDHNFLFVINDYLGGEAKEEVYYQLLEYLKATKFKCKKIYLVE